ncbi:MAG: hypothetical protein JO145_00420 [Acidobacteriaceae bacterium]|nr:hypothetical protein [Acidobacteriaceae bacterium]MBV9764238.1 hypothetical protein [Acidobacteriaceae bacterium]
MRNERSGRTPVQAALLASILIAGCRGNSVSEQYPRMAAVEQYLMAESGAEIAMARSAAPEAIAQDAAVLVLGPDGYRTAVEGKNGFTCLVERSWMSPFDSPEFWNPKIRGPICYNPAAVRTVLPYTLNRTKLILAGLSKAQVHEVIAASVAKKELPTPEAGAMSYMLSKMGYLSDSGGQWCPHLMFHVPKTGDASWGANRAGSPVLVNDEARDIPEPETIFMVPVAHWSDGSAAPHMALQ